MVAYDPSDLTVVVGCGTTVRELDAVLAEHGQECGLDPSDDAATVGGVLAVGLSGLRRLRYGPVELPADLPAGHWREMRNTAILQRL